MKKKLLALILALAMVLSLAGMAGAATHIVEKGDNLSKLAEEYLGSRLKWREIYEANKDQISDPNSIYVGQELVIPGTEELATPVDPDAPVVNEFLVPEDEALTYINPLPLPDMVVTNGGGNYGVISEDPFAVGSMIANVIIPNFEAATHLRFQDMFRGTGTYITEQATRSTADPYGVYHEGVWYLFGSQGSLWVSEDFVNWEFHDLGYVYGMAPTSAVRENADGTETWYLAGNGTHLWAADSAVGPYEDLGEFTWNGEGLVQPIPANNDVDVFIDDDGRMYLYWGMGPGIWGAELDPENPTVLITEPKEIIAFDKNVYWERFGQHHQDYENGFPEGAQMVKINGTYYLTWASAGTQYDSYSQGAYKSTEGPLTGYVPQERPITNTDDALEGTVRGGGHGSVVVGPNGTIWNFYTVNIGYEGDMERRIGCDPVAIDENGDLYVPVHSENPQYVPGVLSHPELGNETGAVELTARQGVHISSYSEGRHPVYAGDNSTLTWWQPAEGDEAPFYLVSLKGNYYVQDFRILWKEVGLDPSIGETTAPFQYTIEIYYGIDNPLAPENADKWVTVVDKSGNTEDLIMDYISLDEPVLANFIRLNITGWAEGTTPGVVEFAAFGESIAKYE